MDTGYGIGGMLTVLVGGTLLGGLIGVSRTKKTVNERWLTAVTKCAINGLPSGSDLNEQERAGLMKTLLNHADDNGITGGIKEQIRTAARDLLNAAGLEAHLKGRATNEQTSDELLARLTGDPTPEVLMAVEPEFRTPGTVGPAS